MVVVVAGVSVVVVVVAVVVAVAVAVVVALLVLLVLLVLLCHAGVVVVAILGETHDYGDNAALIVCDGLFSLPLQ